MLPIGLQLYSVRECCEEDLPGTLKAVAEMGYAGVEFAGFYGRTAPELRAMLDDLGLKCCGTHIGIEHLLEDRLPATIEFMHTLGNRFLIVPGLPEERRNSRAAWLETAHLLNAVAAKLKPHGMQTGYHNHTVEFHPLDGEVPWDTFFGNTVPEVVMQFDTGNAMHEGVDAPFWLSKYPGRATTVHIKDWARENEGAIIGEGETDWPRIFELCEGICKTEWYIVEQESPLYPPIMRVERCLDNLRKMGKWPPKPAAK
jgi:sugar phosphate isomerase/epimerase